jgi:pectinesterase
MNKMKQLLLGLFVCLLVQSAVAAPKYDIVVAKDGSGQYTSVQAAINAIPDSSTKTTVVYIRKGTYKEKIFLHRLKQHVRFIGEDKWQTILTYDDYAGKMDSTGQKSLGTKNTGSFYVMADDFSAENITFENSAGPVGQAVAVVVYGDRAQFSNCRFLGFQDTLYTIGENSREYYKDCYIEGTVDFIFGAATALFEDCVIHGKKGGYLTAASTIQGKTFGYVFLHCTLDADAQPDSYYLGRPWRPYAKTVFIECRMNSVIRPEGWHNWNKPEAEQTAYYAEYKSSGAGGDSSQRVAWSHQLTEEERRQYTRQNILGNWIR